MSFTYTAYGLTLSVPFPCPALRSAPADALPDVVVVEGRAPYELDAAVVGDRGWQAAPGRYLLLTRAARFFVDGGERIVLERGPAAREDSLMLLLLGDVLAAVLRHRGFLVLHASAAITPAGAVAVSGESGVGKSTTLATLMARGCAMLADDVTALRLGEAGEVEVVPGVPHLHLGEDVARRNGRDRAGLHRYFTRRAKVAVPVPEETAAVPAPLRALYLLEAQPGDASLRPLAGTEKFAALQECVYGPLLAEEHPALHPLFAAVAQRVAVCRVSRPPERWSADEIADRILAGC